MNLVRFTHPAYSGRTMEHWNGGIMVLKEKIQLIYTAFVPNMSADASLRAHYSKIPSFRPMPINQPIKSYDLNRL
jgi:hypothetical protein